MKTVIKVLLAVTILVAVLLLSCKKERSFNGSQQKLSIYLTDNPVNFNAVNIDMQKVEIKVETDSAGVEHESWDSLIIRPGVYNLLNFRNGVDTLLAQGLITRGEIKKIRITLGPNNTLVADNIMYPLILKKPVVIIDVDDLTAISPDNSQLNLDFDAGGSIIRINNNQFELVPEIRTFSDEHDGRIEGIVLPADAAAVVSVKYGTQTLIAIPEKDGKFKLRGIKTGMVDLMIHSTANNYKDTTIKNITIMNREVNVGTIVLRK